MSADRIKNAKRVVIKVGGSHLFDNFRKVFEQSWLDSLVSDIVQLKSEGKEVIIVSSGAINIASALENVDIHKAKLTDKQGLACIGQVELLNKYRESFGKFGLRVGQVLLTIEDVENRKRFLSARNVFNYMLSRGVTPIVNENDALATAEIRFGDNDRLAGRVAQIANADLLVLLSKANGVYTANPQMEQNVKFVKEIYEVNSDIENMAGDAADCSGGMSAKVVAAKIAMSHDCKVAITNGKLAHPISRLMNDETQATWFFQNPDSKVKYIF
jgi:glutamate 5-kinase